MNDIYLFSSKNSNNEKYMVNSIILIFWIILLFNIVKNGTSFILWQILIFSYNLNVRIYSI